jgi:hypothetical protein
MGPAKDGAIGADVTNVSQVGASVPAEDWPQAPDRSGEMRRRLKTSRAADLNN